MWVPALPVTHIYNVSVLSLLMVLTWGFVFLITIKFDLTLLIRKTVNAVTRMFAVIEIIQNPINAVTVMPVKMYQAICKHIMFRCHCRFFVAGLTF